MILFIRSQNASMDGRLSNHIAFCERESLAYQTLDWNRLDRPKHDTPLTYYSRLPYDNGNLWDSIAKRLGFGIFAFNVLRKFDGHTVWFCDIDMAWLCLFWPRKFKYVADIYDHYGAIYNSRILRAYERLIYRLVTNIVVVSQKRHDELLPKRFQHKSMVISNLSLRRA